MPQPLQWFPCYAADWLLSRAVRLMSFEQRGLYWELLCIQWRDGGLPVEVSEIAALVGMDLDRFETAWKRVSGEFEIADGEYKNHNLEDIREDQSGKRQTQADKGRKGAQKRWAGQTDKATDNGRSQPLKRGTHPEAPAPHESDTPPSLDSEDSTGIARANAQAMPGDGLLEQSREEEKENTDTNVSCAILFERFCNAYPKRNGSPNRAKAKVKYFALVKSGVDPDAINDGATQYRKWAISESKVGTQFIAQMTTWLNGERWKEFDSPPAPTTPDAPRFNPEDLTS